MAVQCKVLSFAQKTTTGTQAYTGAGFLPTGAFFLANNRTSDGSHVDAMISMGAGTASQGQAAAFRATDNAATSDCAWRRLTTDVYDAIQVVSATTLARANISSFDSDGLTLNYGTADATARIILSLLLTGCTVKVGNLAAPSGGGSKVISGIGIQPTGIIFFSTGTTNTTPDGANGNVSGTFGFTAGNGKDRACAFRTVDAQATMDSERAYAEDACILTTASGSVNNKASLTSFDATGFTLNFSSSAATHIFYYIAFDTATTAVGSFSQPTSTGSQGITGVGFMPVGLLLSSTCDTTNTVNPNNRLAIGMASSSSDRGCVWFGDTDNVADSINDSTLDRTKVIKLATEGTPTVDAEADFTSFDSDGFTVNWSTADATARKVFYFAIGTPTVTTSIPVIMAHLRQQEIS